MADALKLLTEDEDFWSESEVSARESVELDITSVEHPNHPASIRYNEAARKAGALVQSKYPNFKGRVVGDFFLACGIKIFGKEAFPDA